MADSITYSIANHLIRIEGDKECEVLRSIPGFPVFVVESGEPEWRIVFGKDVPKPENWTLLYHYQFEVGAMSSSLAKVGDTYYFAMDPFTANDSPLLMSYQMGSSVVEATSSSSKATSFPKAQASENMDFQPIDVTVPPKTEANL